MENLAALRLCLKNLNIPPRGIKSPKHGQKTQKSLKHIINIGKGTKMAFFYAILRQKTTFLFSGFMHHFNIENQIIIQETIPPNTPPNDYKIRDKTTFNFQHSIVNL
jgi:hypothetical protein